MKIRLSWKYNSNKSSFIYTYSKHACVGDKIFPGIVYPGIVLFFLNDLERVILFSKTGPINSKIFIESHLHIIKERSGLARV